MSNYKYNGKKISKEKLLKKIDDPKTKIESLTIEYPNENKKSGPPTMEGFDIPKDFLISMAAECDKFNAECKVTFSNCGKLGGKTVVITVKQ